jgi:hypothetical protein
LRKQTNEHTVSKKTNKAIDKPLLCQSLKFHTMNRAGDWRYKIHAFVTLALNVSNSDNFPPGRVSNTLCTEGCVVPIGGPNMVVNRRIPALAQSLY